MIFWLFALGWLAQRAQTTWQRVAVSVVLAVTLTEYFPDEPVRGLVVQAGLLMLIWLRTLPVPRLTAPLLRGLAAAWLWIYLTTGSSGPSCSTGWSCRDSLSSQAACWRG
jgi:hypothetical protein